MTGQVHSVESMGLVDGPGIRTVVFFQGCELRCLYCHNPDTWTKCDGKETTSEALIKQICRFKPYFARSNGGVTFSGGEPLLQPEFLLELLKGCKQEGIHTCIDTAGKGLPDCDYDEILKYTDLVLYDIKHYTTDGYEKVTRSTMDETKRFLSAVEKSGTKMWIRHVIVPGITDSEEHLQGLKEYVSKLQNVEKVELLPYHELGVNKYHVMNIEYPLEGVKAFNKQLAKELQAKYFQ